MRVLLYDHAGHNFTYELSRDLASHGQSVVYAFTEGVTAPRGRMEAVPNLEIAPLGRGRTFDRYRLRRRLIAEVRLGFETIALARRCQSRQIITCNMPAVIVALIAAHCTLTRRTFTIWFQDSQAGIAAANLHSSLALSVVRGIEGWGLRRADRVVAISPAMVEEARQMGVLPERVRLLPNWAPLTAIPVVDKKNPWSTRERLSDTFVFLYSGTLGLKHSPERLLSIARWIKAGGIDATMLVVSEGEVADGLRVAAKGEGLPMRVMPFQPAEELPNVLGTADVCVVLLEPHASGFSVPSKVWSYMCAGRAILGSMPSENDAAKVVGAEVGCGLIVEPDCDESEFLALASMLVRDEQLRASLGAGARQAAEERFNPAKTTHEFAAAAGLDFPHRMNAGSGFP